MAKYGEKLSALLITATILIVLMLSGPAAAFKLSLNNLSSSSAVKGDKITTSAGIEVRSDERVSIASVNVIIDNAIICSFNADGTGNCSAVGIDIKLISNTTGYGYGYGYQYGYNYNYGYQQGYNNGILEYSIIIDTSYFSSGTHTLKLETNLGTQVYDSEERTFTITAQQASASSSSGGGGCLTQWTCSQWNACSNNVETRTCTKVIDYCYAGDKPSETQACSSGNTNPGSENNETTSTTRQQPQTSSGITGAVVGALGGSTGIFIWVFIIVIVGMAITVNVVRRRKAKLVQDTEFSSY
jgi:hypothetical protein